MAKTTIEWTACLGADGKWYPGFSFNCWLGCTYQDESCFRCYAEGIVDKRYGRAKWGKGQPRVRTSEAYWKQPILWNEKAIEFERPYKVFCASLADWLDDDHVPIEWLADLLRLIHRTPDLTWLLLSKRPQNFLSRVGECADKWEVSCEIAVWWAERGIHPKNCWIGTSAGTQKGADERIPESLKIPASKHFLSLEPMLEEVNLRHHLGFKNADGAQLDQVIVGGESGHNKRPFDLAWGRSIRDQCRDSNTPLFFKQVDKVRPIPADLLIRQFPDGTEIPA